MFCTEIQGKRVGASHKELTTVQGEWEGVYETHNKSTTAHGRVWDIAAGKVWDIVKKQRSRGAMDRTEPGSTACVSWRRARPACLPELTVCKPDTTEVDTRVVDLMRTDSCCQRTQEVTFRRI